MIDFAMSNDNIFVFSLSILTIERDISNKIDNEQIIFTSS